MIIDHTHPNYILKQRGLTNGARHNGAYYYSVEIVNRIIPAVQTTRNWITINTEPAGLDHSIVFIHNNQHPEHYNWLRAYKDLVLICGIPETCNKVAHLGKPIYLPLSVDVEEVRGYARPKDKGTAFAGRPAKARAAALPEGIDLLAGLPREELLKELARYEQVYAVGRTAIEAKILGCTLLPYDPRFMDVDRWQVLDNLEAAKILQTKLNELDNLP